MFSRLRAKARCFSLDKMCYQDESRTDFPQAGNTTGKGQNLSIATEAKIFKQDHHLLMCRHGLFEEAEELLLAVFAPRVKLRFCRAIPPTTELTGIVRFLCHAGILRPFSPETLSQTGDGFGEKVNPLTSP